jgi:hypothetical protein
MLVTLIPLEKVEKMQPKLSSRASRGKNLPKLLRHDDCPKADRRVR